MDGQVTTTPTPQGAPAPAEPAVNQTPAPEVALSTEQGQAMDTQGSEQPQAQEGPKDLSEAYAMIADRESERAAEAVQETNDNAEANGQHGSSDEQSGDQSSEQQGTQPAQSEDNIQGESKEGSVQQPTDTQPGTDSNSQPVFNQEQYEQSLTNQIKQAAHNDVMKQFNDRGIKKFNLNDLQYMDESNEKVMWHNPYSKNEPFTTMTDAVNFINTYNSQIDQEYNKLMSQRIDEYKRQATPAVELQRFASVYNNMSDAEKAVASVLTQNKAVYGQDGKTVVGFDVDYNTLAQQTKAIVDLVQGLKDGTIVDNGNGNYSYANTDKQDNKQEPTTPALDAKTANATPTKEISVNDLKSISDAYQFIEQEKEKKRSN